MLWHATCFMPAPLVDAPSARAQELWRLGPCVWERGHSARSKAVMPVPVVVALNACPQELWRLDLSTWEWDHLPGKGGPSARSGHRMVLYKGKAILFGGYYDTGRDMRCRGKRARPSFSMPSARGQANAILAGT